jgi:hypothetical protein
MAVDPSINDVLSARGDTSQQPEVSQWNEIHLGANIGDELDGLDISAAAQKLGVLEEDVWRRIRTGQLLARTHLGKVYVYTDIDAFNALEPIQDDLPPPPTSDTAHEVLLTRLEHSDFEPQGGSMIASNQEVALLLDHLSQAKAENREIIRFTSESMARLADMSDNMLKMKDDLIASREEQVVVLKDTIEHQTQELRRIARENENLMTVVRFMEDDAALRK